MLSDLNEIACDACSAVVVNKACADIYAVTVWSCLFKVSFIILMHLSKLRVARLSNSKDFRHTQLREPFKEIQSP